MIGRRRAFPVVMIKIVVLSANYASAQISIFDGSILRSPPRGFNTGFYDPTSVGGGAVPPVRSLGSLSSGGMGGLGGIGGGGNPFGTGLGTMGGSSPFNSGVGGLNGFNWLGAYADNRGAGLPFGGGYAPPTAYRYPPLDPYYFKAPPVKPEDVYDEYKAIPNRGFGEVGAGLPDLDSTSSESSTTTTTMDSSKTDQQLAGSAEPQNRTSAPEVLLSII